jgi:hypothetical protein
MIKKNKMDLLIGSNNAQFFSLTVFIFVIFLLLFFASLSRLSSNEENFNVNRLQITVMNDFVSDFDQIYVEQIISPSLKPAVAAVLKQKPTITPVTKDNLVNIMKTGVAPDMDKDLAMDVTLEKVFRTTAYSFDGSTFDVELNKVEQTSASVLKFTFLVDYSFTFGDNKWGKNDKEIVLLMDIYSLNHPLWNAYIDKDWVPDDSAVQCFSRQVFGINAETCSGLNMKPPMELH